MLRVQNRIFTSCAQSECTSYGNIRICMHIQENQGIVLLRDNVRRNRSACVEVCFKTTDILDPPHRVQFSQAGTDLWGEHLLNEYKYVCWS